MPVSHNSIALIDLSCLFKRTFEANPNAGAKNTFDEILRIEQRVEHLVICLDAPPYSRKEIFPDYKAHREEPTTSEVYQKRVLYKQLEERGYPMARLKGAEADDVIATLARVYGEWCPDVWLVGADKDLAQCVTDNVRQLVPPSGTRPEQFRGPKEVKEKFEVTPEQIPLYLALVGDKSDNIPGVKGIGPVKAAGLVNEYRTLTGIAENLPRIGGQIGKALAEGWEQLVLSSKLTTLDSKLPLDALALLERREPKMAETMAADVPIEFDGFMGNETPMPEAALPGPGYTDDPRAEEEDGYSRPAPIIGKDPRADEFLRQQHAERSADRAAREQQEKDIARAESNEPKAKREKVAFASEHPDFPKWGEPGFAPVQEPTRLTLDLNKSAAAAPPFDPIGPSPGASGPLPPVENVTHAKLADVPLRPPVKAAPREPAKDQLAITTKPIDYGLVSEDLQPKDLRSAEVLAKWIFTGNLYPQFKSPAAIVTVIARGKELGIGMTTALAGFHIVEGKPTASSDLIRSLAKRSPKCKFFRLVSSSATEATWETWHADDPEPTRYQYTIEEAKQAGLHSGNWSKRPRDMLTKTAGSKLARLVYPGETMGMYCPEEMGDYVDTVGEAA